MEGGGFLCQLKQAVPAAAKSMADSEPMTDHEWAVAFMMCKLPGTGKRFEETKLVLEKKLREVREEEKRKCQK